MYKTLRDADISINDLQVFKVHIISIEIFRIGYN